MTSNFDFLSKYWPDMAQLGKTAELYLYADANACMYKIGLLAERVAQEVCMLEKIELPEQSTHADRLRALKYASLLPARIDGMFYTLRRARNDAVHSGADSKERAGALLHLVFNLCCWFMEVYGDWEFTAHEYRAPENADNGGDREDLLRLLREQESKISALSDAVDEIRTAASRASRNDRAEISLRAAMSLPLSEEETDCIGSEELRMDVAVLPAINYAMQQNGTAAIRSITLENTTDAVMENVDIEITASPAFAQPLSRHIDYLPPHRTVTVSRPKLLLNGEYLAGMTEKTLGILHVEVKTEDKVLVSDNIETTVLAFDEWHGIGTQPELLAAFVTPNHPEVAKIVARATEFLGFWTGDTSMDGYQSKDPNRVLLQAAAIFSAIKEQGITYVVPPASFERRGQRVRMCETVMRYKQGTCLDLTLLYASCLEAVGLHPLLLTTAGHIFTGVWLEDMMFPECVQDDFSLITKRLASGVNEIAVVETTAVTTGQDLSFDDAKVMGEQNLISKQTEYIIDVHRARMSHVFPLPQRIQTGDGWEIKHDTAFIRRDNMSAPTRLDETIRIDPGAAEENMPKKVQWERKLLDLGLRNTLINLRMTKTQLPIITDSLDELGSALALGSDFSILPKPADLRMEDFTFDALCKMSTSDIIKEEFKNRRLRSVLTEGELGKVIKGLYRSARTALEENGANTLYIAFGMLKWFETSRSTKARYAPIILIPIEMVRKSANQGYVIRLRDDEPQMNITLLEKLKQDFGIVVNGLDPLPEDDHGIDIRRVMTIMRKAVMEQPHWDVLETACIGIFSFSHFVMWNDIRNRTDDLMHNKIVRSLIEGKLCWDAQPLSIGDRVDENGVLLPMPADASQLYAIRAACDGASFVLHGPPGTGKSQTITSLIANALANGRRVLFVAEKMAALEVVQKRLESIGIGPFCLELHSNKSKKRDVLEQLRVASEVTKTVSAEEYARKAERLANMRAELDCYVKELHKVLACGSDLFELINEYETCKDAPDVKPFGREFIKSLSKPTLERHQLIVERLVAAATETGHPYNHPLGRIARTAYSQELRTGLAPIVSEYLIRLENVRAHVGRLVGALGEKEPECYGDLERLSKIASHMTCWYAMPAAWARTDFPQMYFDEVTQLAQHSISANTLENALLATFDRAFLEQDGKAMFDEYVQVSAKWFLPRFIGTGKIAKTLGTFAGEKIDKSSIHTNLSALRDYQNEKKAASELLEKYAKDLGAFYDSDATDWSEIARLAQSARASARALYDLCGSYGVMNTHCGKAELREAVFGLSEGFTALSEAKAKLYTLLDITDQAEALWMDGEITLCRNISAHADELKEWIAYVGVSVEASREGLDNVVDIYKENVDHGDVIDSYRKAVLCGLISDAIDGDGTLSGFSGAVFNKKIEQYKQADEQWARLCAQEVYCRLASKVPDFTREAAQSSELGILQRNIRNGGRGTSLRKLFDQIPNLLPRLCPCMLMSPISAAQYLDPRREPFDIVVFDEASQLPTCKAVGVLARGREAVIVGDPKQMPPTSFFATNTVDEDNLDIEDLESILDDCLALNMPQAHLLWHYRSRHESLIAFSNSQFYENKLFTFPSVNDRESKVHLVRVDGVFDRGKTRTNKAEAQAVVDEIVRRCKDPDHRDESIGVVTFNISQQHLIDDMLSEACAGDPELEKLVFASEEPIFVKNLENVQGDERDVILFSVGYGPDESGKVYMNFGPLNREGGWRRLNVAVSRARREMTVFSTLSPEQFDLNRTDAVGVLALRSFLEYAEGRALAVEDVRTHMYGTGCDGVAVAIGKMLKDHGYDTDLHVGRSQYRVDVGVIDPSDPERYMLGIMLDGDAYSTAKTTRDREIAQISVLGGLGWQIMRVWCMDWWDNSEKEIKRILEMLKKLQSGDCDNGANAQSTEIHSTGKNNSPVTPYVTSSRRTRSAPMYTVAKIPQKQISADELVNISFEPYVRDKIQRIVSAEAPISLAMITRRLLQSYGIARAGSRIQTYLNTMLKNMDLKTTKQGDAVFYWKDGQDPKDYVGFRVSGDGEQHRDALDVAVQEVANAVCVVLHEQISMERSDLIRETALKLGYTRIGSNVLSAVCEGILYGENNGYITADVNGARILTDVGTSRAEATVKSF